VVASSRTVLQVGISSVVENRSLEHWFVDKQSKLAAWRDWRNSLREMDTDAAYAEVALWWKFVPLVNKAVDPWRQDIWPDPWELVGEGSFCANAQGLGIFYSLVLAGFDCELVLAIVNEQPRLMVVLPNKKMLNYYEGELVDMEDVKEQFIQFWAPSDLANLVKV
jgi:hypothetical protein